MRRRRLSPVAAPLLVALLVLVVGSDTALGKGHAPAPQAVTVNITIGLDMRFHLSRTSVPVGTVRFVIVNRDDERHDFAIAGRKTRLLGPGEQAVLLIRFAKAGLYGYRCTVPGHAALGMRGTVRVGQGGGVVSPPKPPPPPPPPPPSTSVALQLTQIGTFERPVLITAPPGDPDRVFIVEQTGTIRVVVDGVVQPTPFLDLSNRVNVSNESGLLGLAFAPDYATSGLFYIDFTAREGNGNIHVEEFHRSASDPNQADPYSARIVLTIYKPWENHNGGMLQFGPDGYLYISVGDGDSGVYNPPGAFAQTLGDLLGNILRIDPRQSGDQPYSVPASNPFVGVAGASPEIWAYGLRNPWRFWVDHQTGDLYIGDVGLGDREEIDYEPAGRGGFNFGWPCFEGTLPFDGRASCPGAVPPLLERPHAPDVCAMIGGVVAHDPRLPTLDGSFLYSDLCGTEIRALTVQNGSLATDQDLGLAVSSPTSFGEDSLGRMYVASVDGPVYRIDPK